mgnify:CR=1 FL=1
MIQRIFVLEGFFRDLRRAEPGQNSHKHPRRTHQEKPNATTAKNNLTTFRLYIIGLWEKSGHMRFCLSVY